jgi:hypothetical protein
MAKAVKNDVEKETGTVLENKHKIFIDNAIISEISANKMMFLQLL